MKRIKQTGHCGKGMKTVKFILLKKRNVEVLSEKTKKHGEFLQGNWRRKRQQENYVQNVVE